MRGFKSCPVFLIGHLAWGSSPRNGSSFKEKPVHPVHGWTITTIRRSSMTPFYFGFVIGLGIVATLDSQTIPLATVWLLVGLNILLASGFSIKTR